MSLKTRRFRANLPQSLALVAMMAWEVTSSLPAIWRLRRFYRQRVPSGDEPVVVLVGDNMDSTHGISVSAQRMARDLGAAGHQARFIGISHSARKPGPRTADGSTYMLFPRLVQDLFGYPGQELAFPSVREVCQLLERHPVDVVEIEAPGIFGLLVLGLGRWLGISVIHNYRTDLLNYTAMLLDNSLFIAFLHWYLRLFYRFGGKVIVPSEGFRWVVADLGVPLSRIEFIRRGADLGRFGPEHQMEDAWQRHGAPAGPVVMFLGRVSREKGLETLIEAWPRILERCPTAVLGVIGEGPFRQEFDERTRATARTCFAGEVVGDELPRLVASARVLAFPSLTDTFGNAVVEALASGVPAVVTDKGGPCEIVEDEVSGLVFPGEDAQALAERVIRLLTRPDLWEEMSRQARRRALEYRPELATQRHWDFYLQTHRETLARRR